MSAEITTEIHPKALEAMKRARAVDEEKQHFKRAVAELGVRFHTVGGYTFCYRVDRFQVFEVSTALRNPTDAHNVHAGRLLALKRFVAANRVFMRVPSEYVFMSVRQYLTFIFSSDI